MADKPSAGAESDFPFPCQPDSTEPAQKLNVLGGTVTTGMPARSWDPGQIGLGSDGQRYRDEPVRAAR